MKKIFTTIIMFASLNIYAFPEMIRHGYTNCTACHVSPNGGSALNEYGRSLSSEVLSTWSYKNEENFLHGAVNMDSVKDWIVIAGDLRGAQIHEETDTEKVGRYIKMQGGVEVGVNMPKWAIIGSFGQFDDQEWKTDFTRYYALYRFTDEFTARAGRFIPTFGINIAEHIMATRGPILLGIGMERDTAELSWLGEKWGFTGSYYSTPKKLTDMMSTGTESGFAVTASRNFNLKNKFGVQYLTEKNDVYKRNIIGLTGLFGWTEKLYTVIEADQSTTKDITSPGSDDVKGNYATHRTGYEFFKGFHGVVVNDYAQSNVNDGTTKDYKYGFGMQWFPRPHFDFQVFWTKEQSNKNLLKEGDFAWAVFHYYL